MRPKFWWLKVEKVTKMLWKIMIWCSLSFRLERCLLWKWHHSFRSFLILPMWLLKSESLVIINQVECKLKKLEKNCLSHLSPSQKEIPSFDSSLPPRCTRASRAPHTAKPKPIYQKFLLAVGGPIWSDNAFDSPPVWQIFSSVGFLS